MTRAVIEESMTATWYSGMFLSSELSHAPNINLILQRSEAATII
jgi:hypothetical protein